MAPLAPRWVSLADRSFGLLRSLGFVLLVLACCTSAQAEDDWVPPQPSESGWDWARLDTGEWIKGEMIVLQEDMMLFDSDKFDDLDIDWEDVVDLRLARPRVFRLTGKRIYTGMGEIRARVLRIHTLEDEIFEFPTEELISIVYTSEAELRNWRVNIGASLTARAGNTDQQDMTATALIERRTSFTQWQTQYNGTFGEVDGNRTANNHRASTALNFLLTEHFFVRVPYFEFFQDEFQNIDGRYTPGLGVGYELIDTAATELQLTVGAAAQVTRFAGGDLDEDAAAIFGADLSFDLPRDVDVDLAYALQLITTDLNKTNHAASAILSFAVWGPFDMDVGAYLNRIERPERDGDGGRPNRNDFRLTIGFSLDF